MIATKRVRTNSRLALRTRSRSLAGTNAQIGNDYETTDSALFWFSVLHVDQVR